MRWNGIRRGQKVLSGRGKTNGSLSLVSIPLILAFTGHEDVVQRGFEALESMPDYYKTAVGVVFAASFGLQSVTKLMKK